MERFTDGTKILDIALKKWEGDHFSPDCAADFFECGSLPKDERLDCYKVNDVQDLIDAATAWSEGRYNTWDCACEETEPKEKIEARSVQYTSYTGVYYWLDTDDHYWGQEKHGFALFRGFYDEEGKKDRNTEELVCRAKYEDLDCGADADADSILKAIDRYLEKELGFVPEYEVE